QDIKPQREIVTPSRKAQVASVSSPALASGAGPGVAVVGAAAVAAAGEAEEHGREEVGVLSGGVMKKRGRVRRVESDSDSEEDDEEEEKASPSKKTRVLSEQSDWMAAGDGSIGKRVKGDK
ncbi:unnamed protein product, partial [Discosporangium mesarthrocarpum]